MYIAFLRQPTLTKFMAIPYYAYLVLKMSGPHGVIFVRGDIRCTYDYDKESCDTVDTFAAFTELQELKKALAESPPPLGPDYA
jgi:hypothetical protein